MRVARLHGRRDLRVGTEPRPSAGAGDTLLRVRAVGICGSDLHWFDEGGIGDTRLARPLVLGHEFTGVSEEGVRFIADPAVPCEACDLCREGQSNLCERVRFAGHGSEDGALREMIAWPSRCLQPVPEGLDEVDAVMLEPLGVAIHAVDLAHIRPGMNVAVMGCGPVGLMVIQVARAAGACRVVATELAARAARVDAARRLGAEVVAAEEDPEGTWIRAALRGWADVSIEAAGEDAAVHAAVGATRPGGRVVLVGIPAGDRLSLSASVARRKGLTLAFARRMKPVYARALALVQSAHVTLAGLVSDRFALEDCAEAFSVAATRRGLKVVVEP
jgi:L-iditol 2-dehydrogenase